MNENKRVELMSKLVTGSSLTKLLKEKSRDYSRLSIKKNQLLEFEADGWIVDKEFKNTYSLQRPKSNDVAFEDKVWTLFANIGYNIMNCDRTFRLPYNKANDSLSQQIDVFAMDDETILLIECKAAISNKRGDFKVELEAMAEKIGGLVKSVQELFPKKKYKIRYILATKNYSVSKEDLNRLNNLNGLHITEEIINYFNELYSQIGVSAKYQLLGNIFGGQDIPELDSAVPAVEGKMGGHTYYSFLIEPEKLLKLSYVLHRNKANINMMPTYQRLIKKSRLKSVHEFIENGGYFPNSIVVNIDAKNLSFERANTQVDSTLSRVGILRLPRKYRSVYVIDGQHRLYGYTNSDFRSSNTIPVVAFVNLERAEQIKLFMQINENQKAVSKDLRNTLNADLLWNSDNKIEQMRALCSRISISLGEDRDSPLFDKVSIGEDKKVITTQAIENALKKSSFLGKVTKSKIESLGSLFNGNLDDTYKRLNSLLFKCFDYVSQSTSKEWMKGSEGMLLINKGIFGLIMIFGDILTFLIQENKMDTRNERVGLIFENMIQYINPVMDYINNLEESSKTEMKSSYGASGDTKYWRSFQTAIHKIYADFKPDGLEEYNKKEAKAYNDTAFKYIRDIETEFKKDFRERLEEHFGKKWFEKGVPPKISEKAAVDALAKNRELEEDEEVHPWDCLTIIAYREIALKNWQNIFEKNYTRPGEEKINGGKDEKTKWMVHLERIRNQNFHSYSVTEQELEFLEEIHDWIHKKQVRNKYQS